MKSETKKQICNVLNIFLVLLKTAFIIALGLGYFGHVNIFFVIVIILIILHIELKFEYIDDNKNDFYLKVDEKTVFSHIKK